MALEVEALAEYVIKDLRMPSTEDYEADVEWMCKCFGFLESRDKEKTAAKIFKVLLETMKRKKGISSDELAEKTGLTRGTMVHHLNKMIQSGLAVHREGRYELRDMSLQRTVQEVKRDIDRVFEDIEHIAKSIDENLNLTYRLRMSKQDLSIRLASYPNTQQLLNAKKGIIRIDNRGVILCH